VTRIFGPRGDEVTGGWRKLHNEELRDLHSSPSIIRMIMVRKMRWARHAASIGRGGKSLGVPTLKRRSEGFAVVRAATSSAMWPVLPPNTFLARATLKMDAKRQLIDLVQDSWLFRALVETVLNFRIS
jgi:hypothetical protein